MKIAILVNNGEKIKRKLKDTHIFDSFQRAEKDMEHEVDCDTNFSWCAKNNFNKLLKKTGVTLDKRYHPDYSTFKIGWIT